MTTLRNLLLTMLAIVFFAACGEDTYTTNNTTNDTTTNYYGAPDKPSVVPVPCDENPKARLGKDGYCYITEVVTSTMVVYRDRPEPTPTPTPTPPVAVGTLTVAVDTDTPPATNLLMGSANQLLAKFKFGAGPNEDANVTQIVLVDKAPLQASAGWLATNIRLVDETPRELGPVVSTFARNASGVISATFAGLELIVPRNTSKVISVFGDLLSYEAVGVPSTGQTIALALGTNSIAAQGASSATTITATVVPSNEPGNDGTAMASTMTLYRAKIKVAYSMDTTSGAASPRSPQTVMKFVITNLANAGAYTATVKRINVDLSTTIRNTASRDLSVYKDSLATIALAKVHYVNRDFGDTAMTDADFTDVEIASGASKTFFVNLDTTDATANNSLSVRIGPNDIEWSDGTTSGITATDGDLPLPYRTIIY